MILRWRTAVLILVISVFSLASARAEVPEHFYNAPENINPDPNYTPGDWPLPEVFEAKTLYQAKKSELIETADLSDQDHLFTLGWGEIRFTNLKNETAPVMGYFRNYSGIATVGSAGPRNVTVLVDINSLDTGVPGRNNRILAIFFESVKPELGAAQIEFDQFDLDARSWSDLSEGAPQEIEAAGTISLNGSVQPISARLIIQKQGDTWSVKNAEPITLKISDFGFGDRVYDLVKSCNHNSLSNAVEVNVELYLR
jgi:hypothetical protein